ncbi:MAG: SIR2 family protein, partial [Candidatus Cloacimonetes bacterium]|nr:SIR2 family protein [Candidatus Cloacimonadota bacterium]
MSHDPSEHIRGLQQLLISDKKKLAFLFGAGTSVSKKNKDSITIPTIGQMTEDIEDKYKEEDKYKNAISEIKEEIEASKNTYTIETLLSNLEQKRDVIGKGILNHLNKDEIISLIKLLKNQVKDIVSVHEDILIEENIKNHVHADFAEWIGRANRKQGIEIFTTNYDYFFELGFEVNNLPYYDGFTGSYKPFFDSDSVENLSFLPMQTKLWKLHGSLGWHYDENSNKVWRKDSDDDDILIYPSISKYTNSKKQPYASLMDRLTNFLKQPDTILITCGYSFGDEHINERILTALNSNPSTHVYALIYDIVWKKKEGCNSDTKIKEYCLDKTQLYTIATCNRKISAYGCRHAVIGCHFGQWQLKREPDRDDTPNIT